MWLKNSEALWFILFKPLQRRCYAKAYIETGSLGAYRFDLFCLKRARFNIFDDQRAITP